MELPKELKDEIWDYCRANNISNIDEFNLKLIKQGFTIEKFGATPSKVIEKIVEKIVEVPVEKIVEKEIYITDNTESKTLTDKISLLETELVEVKQLLEEEKLKVKNKKDLYGE